MAWHGIVSDFADSFQPIQSPIARRILHPAIVMVGAGVLN